MTLWNPMDQAPLFMGILQARILEQVAMPSSGGSSKPRDRTQVSCIACREILYHLSHQGSPRIPELVAYPFSRGSFWSRNQTGVSCIAGGFFTSWATREAWIRYMYMHIPSLLDRPLASFHPTALGHHKHWDDLPELYSMFPLAVYYPHGDVSMSVLISDLSHPPLPRWC